MKRSRLSILTPVLANPGTIELLPETIASIQQQKLPTSWDYEWIVMEDGPEPKLAGYPWPESVKYRSINKQVGEPSARTLALAAASGSHALAFDADDSLPPDALAKICRAFDDHPTAKYVAGQEATPRHKDPWQSQKDPGDRVESGLCRPGTLYPFYQRTGQFPVTFQSSYTIDTLWRYGGYPAMPYGGDINLFFAVSSLEPGVVLHDVLLNYRRWPEQMTAAPVYYDIEDLSLAHLDRWIKTLEANQCPKQ